MKKFIFAVLFGIVGLVILGNMVKGKKPAEPELSATESKPAPVAQPAKPQPRPAPAPVVAAPKPAKIPDMLPADVYGNFEKQGMTLTKQLKQGWCEWRGKRASSTQDITVEVLSTDANSVETVKVTVLAFSGDVDKLAAAPMAFYASLPYAGSKPSEAQAWVTANLASNASTTIGGVHFQTFANAPAARILRISATPE